MKLQIELKELAQIYGQKYFGNIFIHPTELHQSAIIFNDIKYSFQKESWDAILNSSEHFLRTKKKHPKVTTKKAGILEMQSSNSSDALAMNIFCHPLTSSSDGLKKLFNVNKFQITEFGFKAKVNKTINGKEVRDITEVDMLLNDSIIIECKLTEGDFTYKENYVVEQYSDFEKAFDTKKLMHNKAGTKYRNYQLIRNILAANQNNSRFVLICDKRTPDLVNNFQQTVSCIKDVELKSRCEIIYWQDIAKVVGKDLQDFLKEKYGIY